MATEPYTLQPRSRIRYSYRWHSVAFLATMFILAMVALAAIIISSRADSSPLLDEETISASSEMAAMKHPVELTLAEAGDMNIMLPVYEGEVTAIGYHPTSGDNVISLNPIGTRINGSIFDKGLAQTVKGGEGPGYFIMDDSGELGSSTGAMDIGAPAGTIVFSPVDGTIAGIRAYDHRGECPDTEILIQPQQQANLLVVLTHIDFPEASLGQQLKAGVTRLGSVREMASCYSQQLAGYTFDEGNHLQLQVERSLYRARL